MTQDTFVIFLNHQKLSCFRYNQQSWRVFTLKGEESLPCKNINDLEGALKKFNEDYNASTQLENVSLHILLKDAEPDAPQTICRMVQQFQCKNWQLLQLSLFLDGLNLKPSDEDLNDHNWLNDNIFYLFSNILPYEDKKARAVHQSQETSREKLEKEIRLLQKEKNRLEQVVSSLNRMDMEQLVTFLPAIYQNFWGSIRPDELAAMAQTLQIPTIASPVQEPSPDTLLMLKKRLFNLPPREKERLKSFCKELPHKLRLRPEMQSFLEEENG
ncbi:hypothetical protein [Desulfobotulus mexicanus]|uniref:Uncharacterized protein n=1 Tax=Desulfobotulus mexicanus TaxID=2586642 RepID=A0A5S5MFH3_9BACT|nr:hypothetical protein [Desulfobotulus mexicanus]TYT74481.1 hypothetical protein FIM25_10025 [Desulfobotulus mexicanus]